MLTRTNQIKCDECGKFIALDDLANGKAQHQLATPESLTTRETFSSLCSEHAGQTPRRDMAQSQATIAPALSVTLP